MTRSHRSSPERRLVAGLLLAAWLGAAPAVAQPSATDIREEARSVLADPQYQRELPPHRQSDDANPPRQDPGSRLQGGGDAARVVVPVLGAGARLAKVVFIVLLVVAVVLILGWLLQAVTRRGRAAEQAGDEEAPATAAPEREPAFEDAARLAAEGRFAEAIHALLLAAIRYFADRSKTPIQPSRTSRELVRLLPLGAETREAFTDLVRSVELSLFGGAPVGREDYERSLARFRALTRRPA